MEKTKGKMFLYREFVTIPELIGWLNEAVGLSIALSDRWIRITKVIDWQITFNKYYYLAVRIRYVVEDE